MKICYLLQTYKNPEQIYRLVNTIKTSNPNSIIILSHNYTYSQLDESKLEKHSDVYLLPVKTGRGDFSILREYLSAISWANKNNIDFDWFINLTGQDYPTQPLSSLESLLFQTHYDGFIEYFQVFSNNKSWSVRQGMSRYLYRYRKILLNQPNWFKQLFKTMKLINYLQHFVRIDSSYDLMLGVKVKSPFNDKFICYGGSYFSILSKKCIQYLQKFSECNPHVIEHYQHTINPEESYIQTVLVNSQLFNFYNECKHHYDFYQSRHGAPAILTSKNSSVIKQKNYYFARKFDMNIDNKVLDILDEIVLLKTS